METCLLGNTGHRVSQIGICLPDGPAREALARRAREGGCTVFWSERPVEAPLVLPAGLTGGYGRVRYNLLDQSEAKAEIARLTRERQGVIATHVLAGGALGGGAGREADGARIAQFRCLVKPGRTLVQAAVQFVLANESVHCVLVRVSTEAHLDEILAAPDAPPLTGRDLEQIFELWANRND